MRMVWIVGVVMCACGPVVSTGEDGSSSSDGGTTTTRPTTSISSGDPTSSTITDGPSTGTTTVDPTASDVTTSGPLDTGDVVTTEVPLPDVGVFCGNGVVDPGEQCDGEDLQGFDCPSLGLGPGELSCDEQCLFDTSLCTSCGDGTIQPGEQCDGMDLQGFTCRSLGLGGGDLGCDPVTCTFDTAMCMPP